MKAFLSDLAVQRRVAASTQNQAKSAYRAILGIELPWFREVANAKPSRRLPVVLTESEVDALLSGICGTARVTDQ